MYDEKQIERIVHMEAILDEAAQALERLHEALEGYLAVKERLDELERYYTSPLWMQDHQDDEDGKLPKQLKRGVLSEDAVYDLLRLEEELKEYGCLPGGKDLRQR